MGKRYYVNESFFDEWSDNMAYVLGFIYADGNLLDDSLYRGKYVSVTSTDRDIVYLIKDLLNSEHIIKSYPVYNNRKSIHRLKIGNAKLFKSLSRLGLYPNKSLTIGMPNIPNKFLSHFIRGYFDGDGCVFLEFANGITQTKIIKRLSVIFTSGSKNFLEELLNIFDMKLDLQQSKIYKSHRSFQLRFSTNDSIKIFKFMYYNSNQLFFNRKFTVFKEYFNLRPVRLDKEIESILNSGIGRVA